MQPQLEPPFLQPLFAERLVRIDMPELELDANQCRRLEIHEPATDTWEAWDVEKFAVDGRVLLRSVIRPATADWTDLGSQRYRWVY